MALHRVRTISVYVSPGLNTCVHRQRSVVPTLEYLFNLQNEDDSRTFTIIQAWVADIPSHGRAAVLNEDLLSQFPGGISKHTP